MYTPTTDYSAHDLQQRHAIPNVKAVMLCVVAGVSFGRKMVHDDQARSKKEARYNEDHKEPDQRFKVVEPRFGLLQRLCVKCLRQRLVAELALFFFHGA